MALFSRKSTKRAATASLSSLAPAAGLNIVVGAGSSAFAGWVATNMDTLDITSEPDWAKLTNGRKVDRVLAEHVFEHLTPADTEAALRNIADNLVVGGHVRIAVPDGHHPDPDYIDYVRPGGTGAGASDHKVLFTREMLAAQLEAAGLQANVLECFDEQGQFHARIWDQHEGPIVRCACGDGRNKLKPFAYTSLIIDGVKL